MSQEKTINEGMTSVDSKEKMKLVEFSLNNLIRLIKLNIKERLNKKQKFKIKGLEDEIEVFADSFHLMEIITNLIDNAIKFTPEGKIYLIFQEKRDRWIFKVKDNGIGIARKDFEKIFKEYERVDSPHVSSTEGSGLGLPRIKRLIELHGGKIKFTSVLGMGTSFTFFIPKKNMGTP